MTYEELVAALTAAIDDPPTDGAAGEGDEPQAELLLERLIAAKSRVDGAAAGLAVVTPIANSLHDQYAAELAAWNTSRSSSFDELDRSTRAVETLIREVAPLDPDNPPHYFDSEVDAMDPGTAGDIGDSATAIHRAKVARGVGKRYMLSAPVLAGLRATTRRFERYRVAPAADGGGPRLLAGAQNQQASARRAYSVAFTDAVAFVEYLEIAP